MLIATGLGAGCAGGAPSPPGAPPRGDAALARASQPLIGGSIDAADPGVVALTRQGDPFCTAALVSPSVVLTAAHCIDMAGPNPNITIFFGSDTHGDGSRVGVVKNGKHPQWTGDLGKGNDIGLLLLNYAQEASLALPLNTTPPKAGDSYRVVGFGIHDRGATVSDGRKRSGTTTISEVKTPGDVLLHGDAMLSVCFGDSGGPGFLDVNGVDTVAGVHSWTSGNDCRPPNGDTRVDLFVQEFVLPWIQENDPVCQRDWTCAAVGCTSDPDCEPCGPQGTCTEGCELPDPDCPTSELGELCQASSQCISGACVPWLAEPSTKVCTRPCEPGSDDCPAGMSCQEIGNFGAICYPDEAPDGVLGSRCSAAIECGSYLCDQGRCVKPCDVTRGLTCPQGFSCTSLDDGQSYFCRGGASEEDDGGCSIGGAPAQRRGSAGAWWAASALLLLWRRRHRRATHAPG
jgi:hypothetical protein